MKVKKGKEWMEHSDWAKHYEQMEYAELEKKVMAANNIINKYESRRELVFYSPIPQAIWCSAGNAFLNVVIHSVTLDVKTRLWEVRCAFTNVLSLPHTKLVTTNLGPKLMAYLPGGGCYLLNNHVEELYHDPKAQVTSAVIFMEAWEDHQRRVEKKVKKVVAAIKVSSISQLRQRMILLEKK